MLIFLFYYIRAITSSVRWKIKGRMNWHETLAEQNRSYVGIKRGSSREARKKVGRFTEFKEEKKKNVLQLAPHLNTSHAGQRLMLSQNCLALEKQKQVGCRP